MSDTERPNYEALYHQLVRLRDEMPGSSRDLGMRDGTKWLARAIALVDATGFIDEVARFRAQVDGFSMHANSLTNQAYRAAHALTTTFEVVIAKLELMMPVQAQGAFIPAGGLFDAFQAVAKAVRTAESDVLLVDPYADEKLIEDFAPLVPERAQVRVLSDAATVWPSLRPAAERWVAQYQTRPLEVRLAPARTLHDRLIITDGSTAWVIGQSFKDLAKRAHTSLVRMDPESAALKISAYKDIWAASVPPT
jgi:hypothetical protein